MASSGFVETNRVVDVTIKFNWKVTSTNINNRTSTIEWWLTSTNTKGKVFWTNVKNITVDIDGSRKYTQDSNTIYRLSGSGKIKSQNDTDVNIRGSLILTHDNKGNRNFTVRVGGAAFYYSTQNIIVSKTLSLDTMTVTTGIVSIETNYIFGNPIKINLAPPNSSYIHDVIIRYKSRSVKMGTNVRHTCSGMIPDEWIDITTDSDKGLVSIDIITKSNNTTIGTKTYQYTMKVPENIVPTSGQIVKWDSAVPSDKQFGILQSLSKMAMRLDGASGVRGSTINRAEFAIYIRNDNKWELVEKLTPKNNRGDAKILDKPGRYNITARAIDSRGRYGPYIGTEFDVVPYSQPTVSAVFRRLPPSYDQISILRTARVSSIRYQGIEKNKMTVLVRFKRINTDTWITDNSAGIQYTNGVTSINNTQGVFHNRLSATQAWDIEVSITDIYKTTKVIYRLPTDIVTLAADEFGVGINKLRERGALDVRGDIYANGRPIQMIPLTAPNGESNKLSDGYNIDEVKEPGFYYIKNPTGTLPIIPSTSMGDVVFIRVYKIFGVNLYQELTSNWGHYTARRGTRWDASKNKVVWNEWYFELHKNGGNVNFIDRQTNRTHSDISVLNTSGTVLVKMKEPGTNTDKVFILENFYCKTPPHQKFQRITDFSSGKSWTRQTWESSVDSWSNWIKQ